MAKTKPYQIKETLKELKQLQRSAGSNRIRVRLQMLILIKGGSQTTQRDLATALGCSPYSIQTWKKLYGSGGIKGLMKDESGGKKPSKISEAIHQRIEKRLSNPKDAFRSFKELQQWIHDNYLPGINYHTVNKYVKRNFGAKLKVARKSHVKKDEVLVEDFKKTGKDARTY
jgi:transposase